MADRINTNEMQADNWTADLRGWRESGSRVVKFHDAEAPTNAFGVTSLDELERLIALMGVVREELLFREGDNDG